jgi:uroporphyrinogen-III synthase
VKLENKRILITRPREQSADFAQAILRIGGQPVLFPVIEIGAMPDTTGLDRALNKLACYDWLVLTSVNGVQAVWERLAALDIQSVPKETRVAAIGPKTAAELQSRGADPDFVPGEYVAEAITPGLGELQDRWVLLPRADIARRDLAKAIAAAGGIAHEIAAYRTLPAKPDPEAIQALRDGVEVITFTSSSTVRNFIALVDSAGLDARQLPGGPLFACIGPITASTASAEGLPVHMVASEYTTEGLLEALRAL